jgi:hypothetical protein
MLKNDLKLADHALFKMVRYVHLRPLRPELDVSWNSILVLPFYLLLLFYFRTTSMLLFIVVNDYVFRG